MNVSQALTSEKPISEPEPGIEPATFWWLVRCFAIVHLSYLQALIYVYNIYRLNVIINISWQPLRQHICRTCSWACHLSVGSSMVRASHQLSEGCGFDFRLGLRNRYSKVRAWPTFINRLRYLQAHTSTTYIGTFNKPNASLILLSWGTKHVKTTNIER